MIQRSKDIFLVLSYAELLEDIAKKCEGYSGAALAGVARAAASHALERTVNEFSEHANGGGSMMDCLVTKEDFESAVADVATCTSNDDHSDEIQPATIENVKDEKETSDDDDGLSPN